MLRLALIQMRCEKGALRQNLDTIAHHLAEAVARAADVLVLPEMSLTGYADPARYPHAVLRLDGPEVAALLRLTQQHDITVLAGLIEHNPAGKPFITHVVARRGQLLGVYRKITIKDEETAWFAPGTDAPVFPLGEHTFGLAICADIDNPAVFAECRRQGAEIVFEVAAPGLYGEQEGRNWESGYRWWEGKCREQLGGYARDNGLWIAVATQAGRTLDEDFPGGGYVFAPNGKRLAATADWSPGALYVTIDFVTGRVQIDG
jgi:predicted amidohydrolase